MKVRPLLNKDEQQDIVQSPHPRVKVKGWLTEDGDIVYTQHEPSFCPFTGDRLKYISESGEDE